MRTNPVKKKLRAGEPTFGTWLSLGDLYATRVMARAGFDWMCIDVQHGVVDYRDMLQMLQAVAVTDVPAMVRVPWNDPGWIMKALDAGAAGVIVPTVNTPEEAKVAVGACRYPPDGYRSWGPTRVALGVPDYSPKLANRSVICAVMVETVSAIDRLEEIVAVEGVDAVFIGPSDFAVSMGLPPRSDEPEHRRRLEAVPAICQSHDVVAGIACGSGELLEQWRHAGYTMLAAPSDMVLLRRAAAEILQTARR